MSFEPILEQIVADGPGILAAALVAEDGLIIGQASASTRPQDGGAPWDLTAWGVEMGRFFEGLSAHSHEWGAGGPSELMIRLEGLTVLGSRLDEEILLVLGVAPDGNIGKARYLMRRERWAISQEI